jgi:hypothetical protein
MSEQSHAILKAEKTDGIKSDQSSLIRTFEDLDCWKKCRELRLFVAKEVIPTLPNDEDTD